MVQTNAILKAIWGIFGKFWGNSVVV